MVLTLVVSRLVSLTANYYLLSIRRYAQKIICKTMHYNNNAEYVKQNIK